MKIGQHVTRILGWLTKPSAKLKSPDKQRDAKLLAALLLLLSPTLVLWAASAPRDEIPTLATISLTP